MKTIIGLLVLSAVSLPARLATAYGGEDGTYWDTHSLIYAEVTAVNQPQAGTLNPSIKLKPILTLSGHFDAGKTPVVSSLIDERNFGTAFKLSTANQTVLVILFQTGDVYQVGLDNAGFMPGDHAPICSVNSFDDPKVLATLRAVQKLRHPDGDATRKDDSAEP